MAIKHKSKNNEGIDDSTIIMKMGKGYVIFDAVCIAVFVLFFILSLYFDVTSGVIFFFICIISSVISFFDRKARRIIVENKTLVEKKWLRKQKEIKFSEVDYLTLENGNNTDIICVHSKTGVTINIPKCFQNVDLFETVTSNYHWIFK